MTNTSHTPRTRRQLREALLEVDIARRLAESALYRIGYVKKYTYTRTTPSGSIMEVADSRGEWRAPSPANGITQETLNATVLEAEANTRRDTLQTVINALQLKQYLSPIPRFHSRFTDGYDDAIDAFWADLHVALTVRSERKAAERRDATEAKVAGLVGIDIDTAVKVAAGVPRTVTFTDTAVSLSAGDRALLDDIAKPVAKKKPEAKK